MEHSVQETFSKRTKTRATGGNGFGSSSQEHRVNCCLVRYLRTIPLLEKGVLTLQQAGSDWCYGQMNTVSFLFSCSQNKSTIGVFCITFHHSVMTWVWQKAFVLTLRSSEQMHHIWADTEKKQNCVTTRNPAPLLDPTSEQKTMSICLGYRGVDCGKNNCCPSTFIISFPYLKKKKVTICFCKEY